MENLATICILIMCNLFLTCTSTVPHSGRRLMELGQKLYRMDHIAEVAILNLDYYQNAIRLEGFFELTASQETTTTLYVGTVDNIKKLTDEAKNRNPGKNATSCYTSAENSLEKLLDETYEITELCCAKFVGLLHRVFDNVNRTVESLKNLSSEVRRTDFICTLKSEKMEEEKCLSRKIEIIESNLNALTENAIKVLKNEPIVFSNGLKQLEGCIGLGNEQFRAKAESVHQQAVDCIAKL